MKKFDRVKIEADTKIHLIDYIKINCFDCRHEIWSWDGIKGESLIFCTKDFKNPKNEVLKIVETYVNEKFDEKKHTFRIKDEFVFFNYNMKVF
jgi:hypothetical protein